MDQMLPSPGFSIPSIGTPLHHPEEDQQIVVNNPYYSQQVVPPQNGLSNSGNTPNSMSGLSMGMSSVLSSGSGMMGSGGLGLSGLGTLPAPTKLNSYQPSYAASPQIHQPQTPVSHRSLAKNHSQQPTFLIVCVSCVFTAKFDVAHGTDDRTLRQFVQCSPNDGPGHTNDTNDTAISRCWHIATATVSFELAEALPINRSLLSMC